MLHVQVRKHEDRRTLPAGEYHRWDEVDDDIADDRLHRTLKYRQVVAPLVLLTFDVVNEVNMKMKG